VATGITDDNNNNKNRKRRKELSKTRATLIRTDTEDVAVFESSQLFEIVKSSPVHEL